MSNQTEREKARKILHALAARTVERGCSQAEAMEAMKLLSKGMALYGFTMNEIEMRDETYREITIASDTKSRDMCTYFTVALARFADCHVYYHKGQYHFFGTQADTEVLQYLFAVIKSALQYELLVWRAKTFPEGGVRGEMKSARTHFIRGFGTMISHRLDRLKSEQDTAVMKYHDEHGQVSSSGNTLVVIKRQLVAQNFLSWSGWKRLPGTLKATKQRKSDHHGGRLAGQDAATRVNLSRSIKDGTRNKLLLE